MNQYLTDLLYTVKKLDESLLQVIAMIEDGRTEEAVQALRELTGDK